MVLVAQRQVQHEVLVADEPELDQLIVQAAPGGLRFVRAGFASGAAFAGDSRSPANFLPPSAGPLTFGFEVFRTEWGSDSERFELRLEPARGHRVAAVTAVDKVHVVSVVGEHDAGQQRFA